MIDVESRAQCTTRGGYAAPERRDSTLRSRCFQRAERSFPAAIWLSHRQPSCYPISNFSQAAIVLLNSKPTSAITRRTPERGRAGASDPPAGCPLDRVATLVTNGPALDGAHAGKR